MANGRPMSQEELRPDAIVVVPQIRRPGKEPLLVITKEYRFPLANYEWAFPAGLAEEGESALDVARRELKEETGLDMVSAGHLSPVTFSSAGMTDESNQMIFCWAEGDPANADLQDLEDIETLFLTGDQAIDLAMNRPPFENAYISAKCWPVLLMWKHYVASQT